MVRIYRRQCDGVTVLLFLLVQLSSICGVRVHKEGDSIADFNL